MNKSNCLLVLLLFFLSTRLSFAQIEFNTVSFVKKNLWGNVFKPKSRALDDPKLFTFSLETFKITNDSIEITFTLWIDPVSVEGDYEDWQKKMGIRDVRFNIYTTKPTQSPNCYSERYKVKQVKKHIVGVNKETKFVFKNDNSTIYNLAFTYDKFYPILVHLHVSY